jgi:hypothetical protein
VAVARWLRRRHRGDALRGSPFGDPLAFGRSLLVAETGECRRSSNSLVRGAGVHVIPYRSFT